MHNQPKTATRRPLHAAILAACAASALLAACTSRMAAGGWSTGDAAAAPAWRDLDRCMLPDVQDQAYCGALEVPENPQQPQGRRIVIQFAVLPASGGHALPDPIVPLQGGPGEDAISAASVSAEQFAELRRDRDLLLVDQRGTGRSGALRCDLHADADAATSLRHLFPPEAARRCLRTLQARTDLTQYTYLHAAHDLEHVRRALGYGPLNLTAGSYGTRAAQVFMRAYPRSVRTAYLGSVVPLDVATPLTMAKTAQGELERMFTACAADPACVAAYPRLREEFRMIDARLAAGEVHVMTEGGIPVALPRGRVAEWFRSRLYRPSSAAELPWLIHKAHAGNWGPIVEGIRTQSEGMASALSVGLFLAITCREDVAFIREDDIARETAGTFLGDYRVREQMAACAGWPQDPLPDGYRVPPRTRVPTLFMSGDSDAASPWWFTQRVVPGFADRVEIIARNQGHTEWSDCVGQRYERFVRNGSTGGVASTACADVARLAFRLR